MSTLTIVKQYIEEFLPINPNQKIIVGLSGGADSMALLHILRSLKYNIIAAHCNFHLREEESNRDQQFVERYCEEHSFKLHCISFDTYEYMKINSVSLEMAARELRYDWFEKIRKEERASHIAVAHHRDDSVETVLINLVRGSGIKGLTGIQAVNGTIVRPLLSISRSMVMEYVEANKIPYVTDSTNNEDIYFRNKIRLNIIPLLEELNPSVKQTIAKTSSYLSSISTLYKEYIEQIRKNIWDDEGISIEGIINTSEPKTVLFELLSPYGYNADHVNSIYESLAGISGKVFYSDSHRLIKDRTHLILEELKESDIQQLHITEEISAISDPLNLVFEIVDNDNSLKIEKDRNFLYIDIRKVSYPLCLRKWQQGDRFVPFGMKGSKKVSDYFTDHKFNLSQKENTWLLTDANNVIIWIVGERADNRFRISDKTAKVLRVELLL